MNQLVIQEKETTNPSKNIKTNISSSTPSPLKKDRRFLSRYSPQKSDDENVDQLDPRSKRFSKSFENLPNLFLLSYKSPPSYAPPLFWANRVPSSFDDYHFAPPPPLCYDENDDEDDEDDE